MRTGLIAQKLGMSRVFTDEGNHVAVYGAARRQLPGRGAADPGQRRIHRASARVGTAKVKNVTQPQRGHFAKAKVEPKAKLAEFRVSDDALVPVGAEITAPISSPGSMSM